MIQFLLATCCLFGQYSDPNFSTKDLAGIKCVVSGKQASLKYFSEYKKGRVYFDCNASKLKFDSGKTKFAAKANHQLVVTSQYVQSHCPMKRERISGASKVVTPLTGVVIRFCCSSCRESIRSKGAISEQAKFVFGPEKFDRIFVPNPKSPQSTKPYAER